MFRSYDVAASALRYHQQYLDVVGNNIANVNSDGFKGSQFVFDEVLNQLVDGTKIAPPRPQPQGAINAAMAGLGVTRRAIPGDFAQGAFKITNQATDFGIQGEGYFVLQSAKGPVYTRNGNFTFDSTGTLVAGDGKKVLGTDNRPLQVPAQYQNTPFFMNASGQLVVRNGDPGGVVIGQMKLARFTNQQGLLREGNTEFSATAASGAPIEGAPGTNGLGQAISGVTEISNIQLADQFTNLIMAQRGFQANAKVLTTTDEMADRINQMQ
ncbi:Distal rod protein [Dermatophilus congolensis]|uniref:Distal rod protein n=1 Tax=Dermatophilus congolensis TaxID=1863 RepID=A0AA46BP16_9MICO|nr:flagellar hook-basal body complex protein [Dermatophilus congolensis]STD11749.1 Distal rod protein [Dermatophilus congolensis]